MKKVCAFVVCMILIMSLCACGREEWPATGLAAKLPKPESGTVKNIIESDESFYATVENPGKDGFERYVSACKDKGYTVEAEETDDYEAFNDEGYKLRITSYSDSIHIDLDAPIEIGTLKWPKSDLAKAVPKPASEKGSVKWEHEDSFLIYVGDMTLDQFDAYADTCSDAGFNVDYDRGKKFYRAYNKDGAYLSIEYYGFQIVSIKADLEEEEPEEENPTTAKVKATEAPAEKPTSAPQTEKPAVSDGEVTPEFKEMMDSYETFMTDYVDFMKKYQNSDNPIDMMDDYNDLMADYADYAKKINDVDTDTLSDADYAYYIEVTGRVNKMLLSVTE